MKKLVLPIIIFITLATLLYIQPQVSSAETTYLSCPEVIGVNRINQPLTASALSELKGWDPAVTAPMLDCRSSASFSDLLKINYDLTLSRKGTEDKTEFEYRGYDKPQMKTFGNGKLYTAGTPFGGLSHPAVTVIDKMGSCEIVMHGAAVPTDEGTKLWTVKEGPTAPLLADQKKAGDYLVETIGGAVKKINSGISSNSELARYCGISSSVGEKNKTNQVNIAPIFGINPYQTWLKSNNWAKTFIEAGEAFNRLLVALVDHEFCSPEDCDEAQKSLGRKPVLFEQEVKLEPLPSDNSDWPFIMPYVIQTGKDESVFYNIPGLEKGGGVKVLPDTQLELPQVELDWGEAEFFIIGSNTRAFKVTTPNAEVVVPGTHFWVSHDRDQKQTTVGVYQGKVEVKTKDGKITTVSPDGDKPGIVLVSQKLSVTKLAIAGVVLTGVIGGAILLLRRKFSSKGFGKKEK